MSAIETFGVALPKLIMESVIVPCHPGQLQLHTWNGRRVTTTSQIEHGGSAYTPMKLASGVGQFVRFAPPSLPFGSTSALVLSLRDFFSTYARPRPEAADLLVAFVLATWFCDVTPVAPVLFLFGPDDTVGTVLRLLGAVCRRAILLSDIDLGGLARLPSGLGATLLLNQKNLGRNVRRILLASTRRHFCVLRGAGRLDVHGARAFSSEDVPLEQPGLTVSLTSAQDPPPFLVDADEQHISQEFQAKLLRYRMVHYREVRNCKMDNNALVPEMRQEAHTWLAPICDCPELRKPVFEEILRQSREAAGARFFDPNCVVTEAALFFCHKPNTTQFFVGDLADTANLLLQGRHEDPNLSAKAAGSTLRKLGLYGGRVAAGYKVVLTDGVRQQIHRLAHDYQVASVQDGVRRCRFCTGKMAASKKIQ
jgi:hypothetical protein